MSKSDLVNHVKLSPHTYGKRQSKIDTITIHHMAGIASVEECGVWFSKPTTKASSNYGVDSSGKVGLYVDEENAAISSSNRSNDMRAVTIEVSNDSLAPDWHVSDAAMGKLIELCVDICKRNEIERLNFTGDNSGNLTMHKWFAPTACPGPYLESKFPYIEKEVNRRLSVEKNVFYRVQVGAFDELKNAENMKKKLQNQGYSDAFIVEVERN